MLSLSFYLVGQVRPKVAVLSTFKFSCRNHFMLDFLEGAMYILHGQHFPTNTSCSSGLWPGSGGLNKCCHIECDKLCYYFYEHELHGPLSTCMLPFCTQSVKSELQLAHMQEVQTLISDKPTYHIQEVYGNSLKSVLQTWVWQETLGMRMIPGEKCKLLLTRVRKDKEA